MTVDTHRSPSGDLPIGGSPRGTLALETRLLWLMGLFYVIVYLAFRPRVNVIMDESAYLSAAYAMRHGTVYLDQVGINSVFSYFVGPHTVVQYPPGMPCLLAGVSLLGWSAVEATNLVVHLAIFAAIVGILRHFNLRGYWAFLYLLHPTAMIYSRTVMSDLPSCLCVTVAFLCYARRRFALAGVLIGVSVLLRSANILLLLFLMAGSFVESYGTGSVTKLAGARGILPRLLPAFYIGLSAFPFVAAAWLYQKIIQQGGWARYSAAGQFGITVFPNVFPHYALSLLLLYPGMLLAPALYRGPNRWALRFATYGLVLFYSCYYFSDMTSSPVETFVIGQRYMLSALPLFIVAYAALLEHLLSRVSVRIRHGGLITVVMLLMLAAGVVHRKHQAYLASGVQVQHAILQSLRPTDTLFCNVHVGTLLQPMDPGAGRHFILLSQPEETLGEVARQMRTGKRLVVADWSRSYRSENDAELRVVKAIQSKYTCLPLLPASNDNLQLFEIVPVHGPLEPPP